MILICTYIDICIVILQQPQIILLKEGTDTSQGVPQIISNINACQAIADAVRTTLGPRGMDKLIVDDHGNYSVYILCHHDIHTYFNNIKMILLKL